MCRAYMKISVRQFRKKNFLFLPSTITKPKNVNMTVAIANIINIINGNVIDMINADTPNAKNGCLASCLAILSKNT